VHRPGCGVDSILSFSFCLVDQWSEYPDHWRRALSLTEEFQNYLRNAKYEQAFSCLSALAIPSLDSTQISRLTRELQKIPETEVSKWCKRDVRVALLSRSTVSHLSPVLTFYFIAQPMKPTFWTSEYQF